MKGYRTILVGAAMVVAPPLLTYLAGVNWADYVSPSTALMISGMVTIALRVVTTGPVGSKPSGDTVVKILIAALALSLFLPRGALAADSLPTKAFKPVNPFAQAYDTTKCGGFFGAGTMGTAGSLQGTGVSPGTQVVQAGLGGTVGYGCPINAANGSFWFTDAHVYATNVNGSSSGVNFSNAPVSFMERFAVGSPLQNMLGAIPGLSSVTGSAAVPSLPLLPAGVTAGPAAPYAFAALHQTDVSAQLGLQQNKQWLLSYGLGAGLLYRLSNGVVADVFAEYKIATNDVCVGPLGNAGCAKFGPGFMTGVDFKY